MPAPDTAFFRGQGEGLAVSRRGMGEEGAAKAFARNVVQDRGVVADLAQLRRAGYTVGEVGEIVANVALNRFTNEVNHVAGTKIDFTAAPDLAV